MERHLTAAQRRCVLCCAIEHGYAFQCDKSRYVAVVLIYMDVNQVVAKFDVTGGTFRSVST